MKNLLTTYREKYELLFDDLHEFESQVCHNCVWFDHKNWYCDYYDKETCPGVDARGCKMFFS